MTDGADAPYLKSEPRYLCCYDLQSLTSVGILCSLSKDVQSAFCRLDIANRCN
jgi:hypothetical protein